VLAPQLEVTDAQIEASYAVADAAAPWLTSMSASETIDRVVHGEADVRISLRGHGTTAAAWSVAHLLDDGDASSGPIPGLAT